MANEQYELYQQGTAAALAERMLDLLDGKAETDGYYTMLTAGAADNLTARGDGVTASFLHRTTGGSASVPDDAEATIRSIKGRTLWWNQLADNGNFANGSYHWGARESTLTVADGVATVTPTSAGILRGLQASSTMGTAIAGHKYLISTEFNTNEATNLNISFSGASQVTVVVPSTGSWYKCGAIWTNGNETRILPYLLATASVTTSAQLKYRNVQIFDLTAMFGEGNEPATIAEFESLYPLPYYHYDAGSLLPVNMTGVETTGFNQWDEAASSLRLGEIWSAANGQASTASGYAKNGTLLRVFQSTEYCVSWAHPNNEEFHSVVFYDIEQHFISSSVDVTTGGTKTFTTPSGCCYVGMNFVNVSAVGSNGLHNPCLNLSWSGYRNGEYEAHWSEQRVIAAIAENFPNGMRSAGSVYDELTEHEAIVRVGAVDLGTLTWRASGDYFYATIQEKRIGLVLGEENHLACAELFVSPKTVSGGNLQDNSITEGNGSNSALVVAKSSTYTTAADFGAAMSGVLLFYELATPTTTTFPQPINMDYRFADFGTERVMVPTGQMSAPPTMDVVYGLNAPDTLRTLPTEYISKASDASFTAALAAALNLTITREWNETNQRYDYTITANGE